MTSSASTHKPEFTTLKPVEEAEGSYMRMDGVMEDWSHSDTSPKLISSPTQEECVQSNGPPGDRILLKFFNCAKYFRIIGINLAG